MFNRSSLIDTAQLNASSRLSLKMSCLQACNNDIDKAKKLYDYIADGMDLPDFTPREPSTFEQIRQGAEDVFGWANSHQNDLLNAWNLIKGLRGSSAGGSATDLPEIPRP